MNQKIVNYLQENKDNFSKEVLVEQLKKSGHSQDDIDEAVKVVYGEIVELERNTQEQLIGKKSSNPKDGYYQNRNKKIMDFFIGIGIGVFIAFLVRKIFYGLDRMNGAGWVDDAMTMIYMYLPLISLTVVVYSAVKFWKKGRKFIALGLIFIIVVPLLIYLLLAGACMIVFVLGS